MNILVINGPNLNMLGKRDKIYGEFTYNQMCEIIQNNFDFKIEFFQSNFEGSIIEAIHSAIEECDAIIINPAAFTHYSYAIRDALEIFRGVKVEVHLTDINNREKFRKTNVIKDVCDKSFIGNGVQGYIDAVNYVLNKEKQDKFFSEFKINNPKYKNCEYLDAFYFHYEESIANNLLQLVLDGVKSATTSAVPVYECLNIDFPKVGDLSIVTDFNNNPKCIIETVNVRIMKFKDMTYDICKKEGEDDCLESWVDNHTKFFMEDSKAVGYVFNDDMEILFEEFKVVYVD